MITPQTAGRTLALQAYKNMLEMIEGDYSKEDITLFIEHNIFVLEQSIAQPRKPELRLVE